MFSNSICKFSVIVIVVLILSNKLLYCPFLLITSSILVQYNIIVTCIGFVQVLPALGNCLIVTCHLLLFNCYLYWFCSKVTCTGFVQLLPVLLVFRPLFHRVFETCRQNQDHNLQNPGNSGILDFFHPV